MWDEKIYPVFVGIIINHKPRIPGSVWNNQHSTERNARFFDHGENLVQDKVSDSKPRRFAPGPTIATGHISPPKTEMYGKKVIQLCLQTEKNSTVSNLTIWFCKWLRGDLFYGSFTGPKCFFRHGNTPEARPGPFVTFRVSSISIAPRSAHAHELHELHERRPDPHFWKTIFTVFFLPNWIFLFLTGRPSQFISYEEPTDQTESFWFGMTFQRRFGARPLSVQNSRKSEQQPFKPHRINKSQTRKKKMVLYDDGQSLPPKKIHEKPRKLWLILKLTCFLNQMLAFFQACSRSSKMIVACLRPNW